MNRKNVLIKHAERKPLVFLLVAVLVWLLVAVAWSQSGATSGGFPLFTLGVRVPSSSDLTGALTFTAITVLMVLLTPGVDPRGLPLTAMVVRWALPGSFLFRRVLAHGKDDRSDRN